MERVIIMETLEEKKITVADLTTAEAPTWCAGCGDFGIMSIVKGAIADLNLDPKNTLIVSGIGCGSKLPHFVRTYGFEGLHGRPLPVATAAKIVNPKLNVIVTAGDGDTYGIGGNHFIHAMRRNLDITLIVENNEVYGLTKGQTSPTSPQGFVSNSTPSGALEIPVNPIFVAIAMGASYVARGYSFDAMHLKKLIMEGIKHKGFALIDVFQPCTTYNKINTMAWYKDHLYKLEDSGHDPTDRSAAIAKTEEWGDKIPIGLFFKDIERPTYEESTQAFMNTKKPVVEHDISNIDISGLLRKFK